MAESEVTTIQQESKSYFSKGGINEADYYSPNFANLNNEKAIQSKLEYIHHLNTGSKYKANRGKLLTKLPGIAYRLVGEFLGEKLCQLLFTNRVSFKIALVHQIEYYEQQRKLMMFQVNAVQNELHDLHHNFTQTNTKFSLSNKNALEFMSLKANDWNFFLDMLEKATDNYGEFAHVKSALKKKDIIILKLYALFMNNDELSSKATKLEDT